MSDLPLAFFETEARGAAADATWFDGKIEIEKHLPRLLKKFEELSQPSVRRA